MNDTEYRSELPENLKGAKGTMSVAVKTEKGFTLTREYGFTVEQENGAILAFDLLQHPELGTTILFGDQVFALKFWDNEDLYRGLKIITEGIEAEFDRREDIEARKTAQ